MGLFTIERLCRSGLPMWLPKVPPSSRNSKKLRRETECDVVCSGEDAAHREGTNVLTSGHLPFFIGEMFQPMESSNPRPSQSKSFQG